MLALSIAITSGLLSIAALILSVAAYKVALRTQTADSRRSAVTDSERGNIQPQDKKQTATYTRGAFEAVRVDLTDEEEYWREVEALRKRS